MISEAMAIKTEEDEEALAAKTEMLKQAHEAQLAKLQAEMEEAQQQMIEEHKDTVDAKAGISDAKNKARLEKLEQQILLAEKKIEADRIALDEAHARAEEAHKVAHQRPDTRERKREASEVAAGVAGSVKNELVDHMDENYVDKAGLDKHLANHVMNPIMMMTHAFDKQFKSFEAEKVDKQALELQLEELERKLADEIELGCKGEIEAQQVKITELNMIIVGLKTRIKKLEDEGGVPEDFLKQQAANEAELRMLIDEQLNALDVQDAEIKRLADALSAMPTEEEINAMVNSLAKKVKKLSSQGPRKDRTPKPNPSPQMMSADIENLLENFKYEIRRKTTRDEVLRLISAMLSESTEIMRREMTALQDDPVWTLRTATMDDQRSGRMKFKVFRGGAANLHSRTSPVSGNASVGSKSTAQAMQHSHPLQQAQVSYSGWERGWEEGREVIVHRRGTRIVHR